VTPQPARTISALVLALVLACAGCAGQVVEAGSTPTTASGGTTLLHSTPGKGGVGTVADIAVFFVDGASDQDLQAVGALVQHQREDGRGVAMNDGVLALNYDYAKRAVYVNLQPDATDSERQEAISRLRAGPKVADVKLGYLIES